MKIDPQYTRMDYSVRLLHHLLMYFEDKYGRDELVKFVKDTGMPLDYFNDKNNWVSYDYVCSLFMRLVEYTRDSRAPYNFAVYSALKYGRAYWGNVIKAFTAPASCAFAYKKNIDIAPRFKKSGVLNLLELKKNRAVIEYRLRKDLKPDKNDCLNTQGQFAALPVFWNLPPAKVKEIQCAAEGADSCVYEISWADLSGRKMDYISLLCGIGASILFYLILSSGVVNQVYLLRASTLLIPLLFFLIGKRKDLKKTTDNNIEVMNEQNDMLVNSLEEIEKIHATLQNEVEKRTVDLQKNNEEMGKKLIELSESESQLIQTEKMVAIGRLAAGMAHDLNNPIGTIRNILQDILEEMPADDSRRERLIKAEGTVSRCGRVVADLLSFSRESSNLKLVNVDINEIIERAVQDVKSEFASPKIRIVRNFAGPEKAEVDSSQLQQVFRNIILNSVDAINYEGEINIKTSGDAEHVFAEISDTGEGISEEIISKIFDPFFTTRGAGPRRGIGLAASYNIIKRLEGDIEVKSEKGRGTAFSIVIPRSSRIIQG